MKKQKDNSTKAVAAPVIDAIDVDVQDSEHEFIAPTAPDQKFAFSNTGKGYLLYKSIRWDEWWDEFSSAIETSGKLKHRTAWAFIKAKTRNKQEREYLYEMIGPRPQPQPGVKTLRVPWLGDWQRRRASGFWSLSDPVKMRSLNRTIKERSDALEAARALAPISLQSLARYGRLIEKIDEAFGGSPFLPDKPPTHPDNKKRFKAYVKMLQQAEGLQKQAIELWLRSHGLDPSQPEQWLQMAVIAASGAGAAAALTGAKHGIAGMLSAVGNIAPTGQAALPDGMTATDLLIAKTMNEKSQLYNMPLAEVDVVAASDNKKPH